MTDRAGQDLPGDAGSAFPEADAVVRTRKKHKARIEHHIPGRIRLKVPSARHDPAILEAYKVAFSAVPGITKVKTKPDTASVIIHYDVNREAELEHLFRQRVAEQVAPVAEARPGDEIDEITRKIEAEAAFLAQHSQLVRVSVDIVKELDRQLRLATGNNIDLKIVLALGLAAFTFFEIGAEAATPMWVTLMLFSLNHLTELHTAGPSGAAPLRA